MQWVIKHGGLATEESYGRYLAQVKRQKETKPNFCQTGAMYAQGLGDGLREIWR